MSVSRLPDQPDEDDGVLEMLRDAIGTAPDSVVERAKELGDTLPNQPDRETS